MAFSPGAASGCSAAIGSAGVLSFLVFLCLSSFFLTKKCFDDLDSFEVFSFVNTKLISFLIFASFEGLDFLDLLDLLFSAGGGSGAGGGGMGISSAGVASTACSEAGTGSFGGEAISGEVSNPP